MVDHVFFTLRKDVTSRGKPMAVGNNQETCVFFFNKLSQKQGNLAIWV